MFKKIKPVAMVFLAVSGALMAGCDPGILPSDGYQPQAISLEGQSGKDSQRAGGNSNPGVLPINSTPNGKTYGEWTAAWWQWALSIPADRNPILDTTGAFCSEGQSGPVWFYAATFGNSAERSCTIPTGKTIFMPVFPWIFGAAVGDCEPIGSGECVLEDLQAAAAAATEAAEVLEVTIDGVDVQNIRNYRASSPGAFSITFPEGAVFGLPAGTFFPNVADGYWLMLTPLSPGEHTIEVFVSAPSVEIEELTVITHLTVE